MKVLQTIGMHRGMQEGIFSYRRDAQGILIDLTVSPFVSTVPRAVIRLSHTEWQRILQEIHSDRRDQVFRLTRNPPGNAEPPTESLYDAIRDAVPHPQDGFAWHDSYFACICAILEHEGSMDHYHGHTGPIVLRRDTR